MVDSINAYIAVSILGLARSPTKLAGFFFFNAKRFNTWAREEPNLIKFQTEEERIEVSILGLARSPTGLWHEMARVVAVSILGLARSPTGHHRRRRTKEIVSILGLARSPTSAA